MFLGRIFHESKAGVCAVPCWFSLAPSPLRWVFRRTALSPRCEVMASDTEAAQGDLFSARPTVDEIDANWVNALGHQAPKSWDAPAMEKAAEVNHTAMNAAFQANQGKAINPRAPELSELSMDERRLKTAASNMGKSRGHAHSAEARAFEKMFKKQLQLDSALKHEWEEAGTCYNKQREIKQRYARTEFSNRVATQTRKETLTDLSLRDAEHCQWPRV